MSSQRQPRLGITNTARTTSNTVPMAQNTWQGRMGVSHGAALVNTVHNSRTTAGKVIHVGKRILEARKVRMAVPFPVVIWVGQGLHVVQLLRVPLTLDNICMAPTGVCTVAALVTEINTINIV